MSAPQIKIKIDKEMLKNALALDASDIKTGRFTLDRMPDGNEGKILVAQGIGKNPMWTDPNVTVVGVSEQVLESYKMIIKEELRDRAVQACYKVLSARDLRSVIPGCIGIGSPSLVKDPDTYQPYLIFNAWSDPTSAVTSTYCAPIDEDLYVDVGKVKKIAGPELFNVTGLTTEHVFWDDYNEEWVELTLLVGGPADNVAGVVFLDKDFNVKNVQTLTFTKANGASINLGDASVSPVPLSDKSVLLSCGYGSERSLFLLPNGTSRPLPNPSQINYATIGGVNKPYRIVAYGRYNDVHQLLLSNQGLVMLCEVMDGRSQWYILPHYGACDDWKIGTTYVASYFLAPIPPPLHIHFTEVVSNIGHPHYTNLLKEPYLFFVRSPTWNWGGSRRYAHDLWAARIDPEQVLSPRGKVLAGYGTNEPYDVPNVLPIPTFGARKAIIYLFGVSGSGTLTITESDSPYHIYAQTSIRYQTTYSISSGSNKVVFDNPAPYIALGTNVNLSEWCIILDCR